jgi:hypothetical protein
VTSLTVQQIVIHKLSRPLVAATTTIVLCCPALAQNSGTPPGQKPPQDDRKITYGVENDFSSGYVWRGLVVSDRPVVQPAAWVSWSGFTFIAWSSLSLRDTTEATRPQVADLILMLEHNWKHLRIEPTIEAFLYRDSVGIETSSSMHGSVQLSFPAGPFRLFTNHSVDVLAHRGAYFGTGGVAYQRRASAKSKLDASFHTGWASSMFNDAYIGIDTAAFNFIGLESSLTYYVKPYLYVRPHSELSITVGRQLRRQLPEPNFVSLGFGVGVEF